MGFGVRIRQETEIQCGDEDAGQRVQMQDAEMQMVRLGHEAFEEMGVQASDLDGTVDEGQG